MKRLFLFLIFAVTSTFGATCPSSLTVDSRICINEVDGATQTNRPISFGRMFKQGEIANYPQPVINGTPVTNYQADVKNRWPDTSVKFAVISFLVTISASNGQEVTFQNVANYATGCTGGTACGYLNQAGMTGFNGGAWNAQILVTPKGTLAGSAAAVTVDFKTALGANDPGTNTLPGLTGWGSCHNDYWLIGPVVTAVIIRDCTSTHANDIGWIWNQTAGTMTSGGSASYATTSNNASLFPQATCYFYAGVTSPMCDMALEDPWVERQQDQLIDFAFKTGSPATTQYSHTGARLLTDLSATGAGTTITSASASFAASDVGQPIAIMQAADTVGTATFTNGSATVTGTGTSWWTGYNNTYYLVCTSGACAGQKATISSATASSITLTATWAGTSSVGAVNFAIGLNNAYFWAIITSVTNSTTAVLAEPYQGQSSAKLPAIIGLMQTSQRFHKILWSGTTPGNIRIDHNWPYLKSTMAFPYYDPNVTVSTAKSFNNSGVTSWTNWSTTSKGDSLGLVDSILEMTVDYANNSEGAPLQREDLLYLYNMGSCGTANSECAKAVQMTQGFGGDIDTTGAINASGVAAANITGAHNQTVIGGAGSWNMLGNVPFHLRESRTTATGNVSTGNAFYCANFADKDANVNASTCGTAQGDATGKFLSKHAHSIDQYGGPPSAFAGVTNPGSTNVAWDISGCNHWQDLSYTAYVLTGDYYYLEDEYAAASMCIYAHNPDPAALYGGANIFGLMNSSGDILRETAWGLQQSSRAAFLAPDLTPESAYYLAMTNSTLEWMEGILGIVGTSLTPSDTSCSSATCTFDAHSTNRWNYGRASASGCSGGGGTCTTRAITTHQMGAGYVDTAANFTFGNGVGPYISIASTDSYYSQWMYNYLSIVFFEMRDMGYSTAALSNETGKQLEEMVKDSTFDPYLISAYINPVHNQLLSPLSYNTGTVTLTNGSTAVTSSGATFPSYSGGTYTIYCTSSACAGASSTQTMLAAISSSTATTLTLSAPWAFPTATGATYVISLTSDPNDGFSLNGYYQDYASMLLGYTACQRTQNTFDDFNQSPYFTGCLSYASNACDDHGYSLTAKGAGSFLAYYNINATNAHCPGGTCTAAATQSWLTSCVPYFGNSMATGATCGNGGNVSTGASSSCQDPTYYSTQTTDRQIKYALAPRAAGVTVSSCTISPSSATITAGNTQAYTSQITWSDASVTDGTSTLSLSSGTPGVATVSGQTATGVSAGSSTITGTNTVSCGTSTLTVNAAVTRSSRNGVWSGVVK